MRDRAVRMKLLREQGDGTYTALLDYPNGVTAEVNAPTFRKMVNMLRSMSLNVDALFEFEVSEGMGFLERALR